MTGITIGLDLGSAKCGIVAAADGRPRASVTIPVDADDVGSAWHEIERAIVETEAARVVVEWGHFYLPPGSSLAAATSMARAREVQVRLIDRTEQLCAARGVPLAKIAAATWRKRIGVEKPEHVIAAELAAKDARATSVCLWAFAWLVSGERPPAPEPIPSPSRSWVDRAVHDALTRRLGVAECETLQTVHERDAMGGVLGDLLAPPPVVPKAPRPESDKPKRDRSHRPPKAPRATLAGGYVDEAGERAVAAIVAQGGRIRLDVLAVRLALPVPAAHRLVTRLVARGLVTKPERGIYVVQR